MYTTAPIHTRFTSESEADPEEAASDDFFFSAMLIFAMRMIMHPKISLTGITLSRERCLLQL